MASDLRWSAELQTIPTIPFVCLDILLDRLCCDYSVVVE